ncbi:MAG: VanZ family protein [Streptococcaceae bacterium]|jgi:glycopeptide antibiotics resistance protein|nr:VanZ family protein [Streptococcaceae bacterium]
MLNNLGPISMILEMIGLGQNNSLRQLLFTIFTFIWMIGLIVLYQLIARKKLKQSKLHYICVYVFLFYLLQVFMITGIPSLSSIIHRLQVGGNFINTDNIHLVPFVGEHFVSEVYNVIMTVPFGFFVPFIWPNFASLKKVTLLTFSFSLLIELSQLFTRRAVTFDDLLMNTLGGMIGFGLFILWQKMFKRKKQKNIHIKNELVIYIALSFVALFFQANLVMDTVSAITPEPVIEEGQVMYADFVMGTILAIEANKLTINQADTWILPDGSWGGASDANNINEQHYIIDENTQFILKKTDGMQVLEEKEMNLDQLQVGDLINIESQENIARKVIRYVHE